MSGGAYHVTMRGNNRFPLFYCDADRRKFSELVHKAANAENVHVLAYCWMSNHVHLAVRVGDSPLSGFVHRVASQFARYLNWRRQTTGHVFERRYFASFVDVDEYLLQLVRYIDLNPVKAKIVSDPKTFRWGSHRHYLLGTGPSWLHCDLILSLFSADTNSAIAEYRKFVLAPQDRAMEDSLPVMLASSATGKMTGEIIPGDQSASSRSKRHDLDRLVDRVCSRYRVSRADITGPSKSRALSSIRLEIVEKALDSYEATFVEIGRCLNRSGAAISQLKKRRSKAD